MTEEEAHIFIDELFNYINTKDSKIFSNYVIDYDSWVSAPIKLQFFGGEVLLYPDLILDIIKYFKDSCYKNNLGDKWETVTIQIDTNGTLLQDKTVEQILELYKDKLILGITFEGTEECHDFNRKSTDGEGSFKKTESSVKYLREEYSNIRLDNKLTITRDTVDMLPSVIKALQKLGYYGTAITWDLTVEMSEDDIEHYYNALCKTIDWIVDNNIRFYLKIFGFRYNNDFLLADCGTHGSAICIGPGGVLSMCQQANASLLGEEGKEVILGDIYNGITNLDLLTKIRNHTATKIEPKQCINCPIRRMCDNCPAINYKVYHNLNKTFHPCGNTVAGAMAQLYLYKKVKEKGDYPYYEQTIAHIENTNKFDPEYQYWYKDNYETEWIDTSAQIKEELE